MTTDEQIIEELKKINQQLSKQQVGVTRNLFYGLFYSLGTFVGYILIIVSLAYFASQFNWTKALSQSFENIMSQINWTKIVPQTINQFDSTKIIRQ